MRRIWVVAAALALPAGYGLAGRNVSLPPHVKVIAIPPLLNRTADPELERAMTDALRKELSSRGKWKVVPNAGGADVDAVVTGTVLNLTLRNIAFNDTHQVTRVELGVVAGLEFKDVRDSNKLLWSNGGVVTGEEYPVTSGTSAADPAAFLRQNNDAYQRLATKFARAVVSAMLEGM